MCVWAAVRFSRELPLTSLICTMFIFVNFGALAPQFTDTCEYLLTQAISIRFQLKSDHWSFLPEGKLCLFSWLANCMLSVC